MEQLYTSMANTDLQLVVGGERLPVHKFVLVARAPFFRAMFAHQSNVEFNKTEIELRDVSLDGLRAAVEFMYTDRVRNIEQVASEALIAADQFCMARMKEKCEAALVLKHKLDGARAEDVCDLLQLADMYTASTVKEHALAVFQAQQTAVMQSAKWRTLMAEHSLLAAETLQSVLQRQTSEITARETARSAAAGRLIVSESSECSQG